MEHFQEFNLVWNGERGRQFFSKTNCRMNHQHKTSGRRTTVRRGTMGWAAYKVSKDVMLLQVFSNGSVDVLAVELK